MPESKSRKEGKVCIEFLIFSIFLWEGFSSFFSFSKGGGVFARVFFGEVRIFENIVGRGIFVSNFRISDGGGSAGGTLEFIFFRRKICCHNIFRMNSIFRWGRTWEEDILIKFATFFFMWGKFFYFSLFLLGRNVLQTKVFNSNCCWFVASLERKGLQ